MVDVVHWKSLFAFNFIYRYEDDPIIGHRLYREIRKVEVKKGKGKNVPAIPHSCYQWETVATNFDEFGDVSVSSYHGLLLIFNPLCYNS